MGNLGGNILGLFASGISILAGFTWFVEEDGGLAIVWGIGLIAMGVGGLALMANANGWGQASMPARLRGLEAMREQGIIAEEEYAECRMALIEEAA